MALRDLKSNLKTLKVDKDRPGGGSSGLPYIKGGLPEDSPAGEYIADLARYSSDGTVRGGLYSTVASTNDSIRISRFLNDFPKGLLFTSKQVGLAKSNPLIETETRGETLNTQVYSNSNLLSQVLIQGNGEHIPYYGFNKKDLLNDKNKYEEIVSKKTTNQNRLVTLYNNKILNTPPLGILSNLNGLGISDNPEFLFDYTGGPGSSYGDGNTEIKRSINTPRSYLRYVDNPLGFTSGYNPSFKITSEDTPYVGGTISSKFNSLKIISTSEEITTFTTTPSSPPISSDIEGNQQDIITPSTSTQTKIISKENFISENGYSPSNTSIRPENLLNYPEPYRFGNTMAYSKLLASKDNLESYVLQDFRSKTINPNPLAENYGGKLGENIRISTRIGVGDPGARPKDKRNNFYTPFPDGQDKVNMSPIYTSTGRPEKDGNGGKDTRDLIKFIIEAIDNTNLPKTERMHFRAFITNFSDNIGADWNSQRYMGRGENFYTYQGFTREVGFTFKVAAQSVQEMEKLYQKLNYLASTLHPDYNTNGFMRGTIHKLTIGEYFYRMPGIIKSMNIIVDDNYPWETKMSQPELEGNSGDPTKDDRGQMEVPQILNVQMSFNPIYDNIPKRGKYENIIVGKVDNNYLERPDFK